MRIKLKTSKEIELLREGGLILGTILERLARLVEPGASTAVLEERANEWIEEAGGRPAFKGYAPGGGKPFPTTLCTSINNEVVHGPALPERFLKKGDIISLDIGMQYKGLYTDTAVTVPVGPISSPVKKLIDVTRQCLELGIRQSKPGNTLRDIARAIQINAEANKFSVIRELVGHGVGHRVHEDPNVPNYDTGEPALMNFVLKPGLVIAIEPMVSLGNWPIIALDDGFTYATDDNSLVAHFEHTIAITEDGPVVLTAGAEA